MFLLGTQHCSVVARTAASGLCSWDRSRPGFTQCKEHSNIMGVRPEQTPILLCRRRIRTKIWMGTKICKPLPFLCATLTLVTADTLLLTVCWLKERMGTCMLTRIRPARIVKH